MKTNNKEYLIAAIGEEDTITGLLLSGIGQISNDNKKSTNFLIYKPGKTEIKEIEDAFDDFTIKRDDIAVLLINQHIANIIRHKLDKYDAFFPSILEIPSKEHSYSSDQDWIIKKVKNVFNN